MPGRCGTRSRQLRASGRGERRRDDLEILGAVGVGQDDEVAAVMLHSYRHAGVARGDEPGRRARVGAVEQPDLGGLVVARPSMHDEGAGLGHVEIDEQAGFGLLVDERVLPPPACRCGGA